MSVKRRTRIICAGSARHLTRNEEFADPTHVMMCSLSLQAVSPPLELCTSPARIALSRMSEHAAASHAAGTVRRTSAASACERH